MKNIIEFVRKNQKLLILLLIICIAISSYIGVKCNSELLKDISTFSYEEYSNKLDALLDTVLFNEKFRSLIINIFAPLLCYTLFFDFIKKYLKNDIVDIIISILLFILICDILTFTIFNTVFSIIMKSNPSSFATPFIRLTSHLKELFGISLISSFLSMDVIGTSGLMSSLIDIMRYAFLPLETVLLILYRIGKIK